MTMPQIKRALLSILLVGAVALPAAVGGATRVEAVSGCPWMNTHESSTVRAQQLLHAMTMTDKIQMVTGAGEFDATGPNPGAASYVQSNPALCIPTLVFNDAIAGMGDNQVLTTAFPDSIGLTATWDAGLTQTYGRMLGQEAFAKGINVVLGPGVDIARNPLNGRNFEYAGEDPFLAGAAAAAVIRGVQSEHVVATVKHYALNDQERFRNTSSSDPDERTTQEIHLPAYEAAVKQGDVGSTMCAYNRIHGVYACENSYLQRTVLDKQFGFTGWIVSDWGGTHSTVASAKAGLDMEMPSGKFFGAALQAAVQQHKVPAAVLDEMVYRIVFTMFRLGLFDHVPAEGAQAAATNASTPQSIATAIKVAEDGTVLLKNNNNILPLSGPAKRIAVIGPAAGTAGAELSEQGYGSGHVPIFAYQPGVVSPLQSITTRAAQAGDVVTYADGSSTVDAVAAATAADVAVVVISDAEIEGADRPDLNAHVGTCSFFDFAAPNSCTYLPIDQNALVSAVAAANPHTVVVIQSGGPIAMPWVDGVQGIVENWYPGQVDGDSIAPILFGDVNPSGKLPVTFPVKLSDGPLRSAAQYPGVNDKKGIPRVHYSEGLLVGYRWYDAKRIKPLFPFGFGLSYTNFRYSQLKVTPTGAGATVRFAITNTGKRTGAEIGQVYVTDPASLGEPPIQLKGFTKVMLRPGETKILSVALDQRAFSYWSTAKHAWTVAPGCYGISVGGSSQNLPLSTSVGRAHAGCGSATPPQHNRSASASRLPTSGLRTALSTSAAVFIASGLLLLAFLRRRRSPRIEASS